MKDTDTPLTAGELPEFSRRIISGYMNGRYDVNTKSLVGKKGKTPRWLIEFEWNGVPVKVGSKDAYVELMEMRGIPISHTDFHLNQANVFWKKSGINIIEVDEQKR